MCFSYWLLVRRLTPAMSFCVIHFISFMFYVVFDHHMDWGNGGDSDQCVDEFTDRAAAIAWARELDARGVVYSADIDCTDSWIVRRVMHDGTPINWAHAG